MLVSVGMPIYNRKEGFERALQSVLAQSFQNLEIIISNDHSPNIEIDRLARKYAAQDSRIRYYYQEKPLRTVGNFSFVKNQASGKYFFWLADDDWIDPDFVSSCVSFLENNPDYTIACGKCCYHETEQKIIHSNSNTGIEQSSLWKRSITYFKNVTLNGYFYGILRTAAIQKVDLPNELGFDWIAVGNLCFEGKIKVVDSTCHHLSKGGMSNEGNALSKYFATKNFLSSNFIGLSTALNCSAGVWKSKNIQFSFIKRAILSCIVFFSTYLNTIQWDILFIKRKIVKLLGINKDGVLIKKKV